MLRTRRLKLTHLENRLTPALAVWDGGALNNNNWTTAANWVGDIAPNPGDDLAFPAGVIKLNSINNFPANTAFSTLQISGLGYQISGNAINLADRISATLPFVASGPDTAISLPVTLTAANTIERLDVGSTNFIIAGAVNLNGNTLDLEPAGFNGITFGNTSSIIGTGNVTQSGNGTTIFNGTNTFAGTTTVNSGTLTVNGQTGTVTVNGAFLSGTGTLGILTSTFSGFFPGIFSPGSGVMTSGNFEQSGGSINYQLNPGTPNTVSRLDVNGTVKLGGSIVFGVDPAVVSQAGDTYTLIRNDGSDPIMGTFDGAPEGSDIGAFNGFAYRISYVGGDGNDVTVTAGFEPVSAVGAGAGGIPLVNVFNQAGLPYQSFLAYDQSFRGGVRVAVAEVTGDSVPDIITAPGPGGGPVIRIFDGNTFQLVREFLAYDANFFGGVFISAAVMEQGGLADIATGAGAGGGPHVKLFDATGAELNSFMAYNINFTGGVSVATHELTIVNTGGGPPVNVPGSIVTGAGPGGGPHVRVFEALTGNVQNEFLAYDASFFGGVNVAVGTVTSPSQPPFSNYNIITGPASNGPPVVRVFDGTNAIVQQFFAYDPGFFGGVTLSTIRLGQNFSPILLTGTGPGGAPLVNQYQTLVDGSPMQLTRSAFAFDPAFTGGIFVG